jgi:hypothetical protein
MKSSLRNEAVRWVQIVTETITVARATEQLRQEKETFDQAKQHESRWFVLRLVMGYSAVFLLGAVILITSYVLFNNTNFPIAVVTTAGAALFVDVLGLLIAVWKIALNPNFYARVGPVTQISFPDTHPNASTSAWNGDYGIARRTPVSPKRR